MDHPKGMYIISLTEMMERFSFYIFVAIIVLFMMQVLHFSAEFSTFLYGIIVAMTYLSQLAAGYLTDRFINNRRSIIIGGIFAFISQMILAYSASLYYLTTRVPDHSSLLFNYPEMVFFIGILFMVIGTGFLKVSLTSFVGLFYDEGDSRIDSAYTIFYMFINIGAFLAPILAHFVVGVNDPSLYQYGFLVSGVIVFLGIIFFIASRKYLCMPDGEPVGAIPISKNEKFIQRRIKTDKLPVKLTKTEISHVKVILLAIIVVILFEAAYEQIKTSLIIFDMLFVNNTLPFINHSISPEFFLSLPPLFVIIFSLILIKVNSMLSNRNEEVSSISKFGSGLIIASLAFVALLIPSYSLGSGVKMSMIWLFLFALFIVLGELLVMPVSLSFVSKLAPPKYTSLMMGVMFGATASSEILAGILASAMPQSYNQTTMLMNFIPIHGVTSFMWVFIIFLAGSGVIWLLLKNRIKELADGEII